MGQRQHHRTEGGGEGGGMEGEGRGREGGSVFTTSFFCYEMSHAMESAWKIRVFFLWGGPYE